MKPSRQAIAYRRASRELFANLRDVETYLDSGGGPQQAACYMRDFQSGQHFWSPDVFHWFGLPVAEQAPPMDQFLALLGPQQVSDMVAAIRRCVESGNPLVIEYRVRQRDGGEKRLRSIGQRIPSRSGRGAAVLGTAFDLTGHHRARTALRTAFATLMRVDSARGAGGCSPRDHLEGLGSPADGSPASQAGNTAHAHATARAACASGGLSERRLNQVCELMHRRLREPLSVAELAAAAGLSAAHFARAFKQSTGKSPHRFLLEQRLERARLALTGNPASTLAGVAIDFGFFDQSHFTRHFRRKFGVTPADFLRRNAP